MLRTRALHRFAVGTTLALPIIGFRAYWNRWRFWGTVAAMTILQVAAVAGLRPLEELRRLREDNLKAVHSCTRVLSEHTASQDFERQWPGFINYQDRPFAPTISGDE